MLSLMNFDTTGSQCSRSTKKKYDHFPFYFPTWRKIWNFLISVPILSQFMDFQLFFLFQVHEYLRSKLCSLYENDCIFDKFECCWNGNDTAIMTGSYNNFFRMFDRQSRQEVTYEASKEIAKPKTILKPRKVTWIQWFKSKQYLFFSIFVGEYRWKT